ncbi:MAG: UDP-N-acetylmuramate:L-alanyl-gamma-D-glutamyl-meso-diaminopimelate ligase [Bacteroidota bacterium]
MRYYFLGIAGTAMASVAVLLKKKGHEVWGTDTGIYPPMSDFLEENQIPVKQGFSVDNLKQKFDYAVIGNAMTRGNEEVEYILNNKLPFISMTELIRNEFIQSHRNIVITGTHGKTTTTALMSWVLETAGLSPSFLVGGIAKNFDSSVQLGNGEHFVIEGDEYDSAFFDKRPKFVHYFPDYLVINNIEFDHADIYNNLDEIKDAFRKMIRTLSTEALIIANADSPAVNEVLDPVYSRLQMFGNASANDWSYEIEKNGDFFILQKGVKVKEEPFSFPFPGEFHVQNATAVAAIAYDIGISWEDIANAFETFESVKRRQEYWGKWHGADVYDDFAHHPTAIKVTLEAMKKKFPERRLVALFEPRSNTTVRNFFQDELADALSVSDEVLITPLHRLEKIAVEDRLSITKVVDTIKEQGVEALLIDNYDEIIPATQNVIKEDDIFILLTNGNMGGNYSKLRDVVQGE